ncbi:YHYH protein [Polynucleobacter sp. AP-Melu-500A-A1]|uniref:YHYH protein n=1 Tax=Polynucleobacter sp. AP-Melu-500A-A1 TaxID=2576929 RepID=UPI001C0B2DF0|nr:YHYH protein [Polynucleobacter sp. AP-Melu-500A-A1]
MTMRKIAKRNLACIGLVILATIGLYACGGSSDSSSSASSSDPGTPTTLVTSTNGASTANCAQNNLCMDFTTPISFGNLVGIAKTLSQLATPWTDTSTNLMTISQIPYVSGANSATAYDPAGSVFTTTTDAIYRYFQGNGLPSTKMGTFPVQSGTAAYPYYAALPGGTNQATGQTYSNAAAIGISPYNLNSKLPLNPMVSGFYPINSLIVGITLTGAVWHAEVANDATGNWYNPTNALPLDQCWGHPYNQQYHLHGYSWKCFPNQGTSGPSPLFGYALDGFGIYGPRGEDGQMVTNAQLDQCHGHTAPVQWNGALTNIYHYHLNREYPYSVGCFRGIVDYDTALGPPGPNLGMKEGVPYGPSILPNINPFLN